jgi:hypothetical protein
LGEWVEGKALRFRVTAIRDCGSAAAGRSALTQVAFAVHVIAGAGEVFVSPRDITLEGGGVILQTIGARAPLVERCGKVLTAQRLPARQSVEGLVVFAVSPEFRSGPDLTLAYRPTRWGGAGRLLVRVPRCLEACKERRPINPAAATAQNGAPIQVPALGRSSSENKSRHSSEGRERP